MRIHSAAETERYCHPLGDPQGTGGIFVPPDGPWYSRELRRDPDFRPVDAAEVARVLADMQTQAPLGWCDGLEVWCLPGVIASYQAGSWGLASAAQTPSHRLLVLSARPAPPVDWVQLIGHELGHAFDHIYLPGDTDLPQSSLARELCQLAGIPTTENHANRPDVPWAHRWAERLAEYLMHALWGRPCHPFIPTPSPEQTAALRKRLTGLLGNTPARIEVATMTRTITLRIGADVATVDGRAVTLDAPAMLVPPGRTMVPLRFVSEALGCRVDWDGDTQTVTITQEVPGS